jgi:16S rRNA (cytidine1402-2'-O)-methyltransferase
MKTNKQKTGAEDFPEGRLFICATPIGNLDDVTLRLLKTLESVDLIIAEDTRTIRKILTKYNIKKPGDRIISYQDYADEKKIGFIIGKISKGNSAALVSESGLPVIQDPGYRIVKRCIESGIEVTVIPGPNAALSALVMSGIAPDSFVFVGFLPKTSSKRAEKITGISYLPFTMIFYESPKRISRLLKELLERIGDRQACLAREITKVYEEVIRGSISVIIDKIRDRNLKGEIVLVVEGYKKQLIEDFTEKDIEKEILKLLNQNIPKKEVLKILQSRYDIDRQKLYNIATRF